MTRRDAIAGLAALPAALSALAAAGEEQGDQKIMGPTVFHWEEMTAKKTDERQEASRTRRFWLGATLAGMIAAAVGLSMKLGLV